MEAMDPDSVRLQEIRASNTKRWKLLRQLHQEYLDVVEEQKRQPRSEVLSPPITLLECELEQLQAFPPITELPVVTSRDFAVELVESHRQLADAQAVLEHCIELEKKRLQTHKTCLKQQEQMHKVLNALQTEQQQKQTSLKLAVDSATLQEDGSDVDQTNLSLAEENQWLKEELKYVSELIEARWQHENDASTTTTQTKRFWPVDKLVLELINQFLTSPDEPYLVVDAPTSLATIHPRHVEFLESCCVVQRHEDNPNLISIADYYTSSDHN